jgi:hypothetical protein
MTDAAAVHLPLVAAIDGEAVVWRDPTVASLTPSPRTADEARRRPR